MSPRTEQTRFCLKKEHDDIELNCSFCLFTTLEILPEWQKTKEQKCEADQATRKAKE